MTGKKILKKIGSGMLAGALVLTSFLTAGKQIRAYAAEQKVSVKKETVYYYKDYGFGDGHTYKYTVSFGDVKGTAYCVQPSKTWPESGEYSVKKLSDGKKLAKVCFYGTKASGDDSFFSKDSDYGELAAGARYILVHIAAAYAAGSSDAFHNANDKAKKLAMKLYDYCIAQPDIPDVDMSFSEDSLQAYADGDSQRTKTVTFRADAQQSITLKLPKGVCLYNETSGKLSSAGANVTITGGTKFYLQAPLTQSKDVSGSWSAKMKGSITKDFSAYRISTGSDELQDLALVFGDGVTDEKYVSLSVNWVKTAQLSLIKTDAATKKGVAGAVYGIYSDSACRTLIKTMPATDAKGQTKAFFVRDQDTVYVREISVPAGYTLDTAVYTVSLGSGAAAEVTVNVSEKETPGEITVKKVDAGTGTYTGQGDATLQGAVYGLYAKEDIVHPDGQTGVLYRAGSLVARQTFGVADSITFANLHLGSYYVKEITPPRGYTLDPKQYDVPLKYVNSGMAKVGAQLQVSETVIRQAFQIMKVSSNGSSGALSHVSGAEFTVKLKSEVEKSGWDSAKTYDTLVTDSAGYVKSQELPYGVYVVRETKVPQGLNPTADFEVSITEDSREPQPWIVLNDTASQAYIRIVKKDARTHQTVLLAGTAFKIWDVKEQKFVTQKTGSTRTDTFVTGEDGTVTTPLMLEAGEYELAEIEAPEGYVVKTERVPFTVTTSGAVQMELDEDGDPVIEVVMENEPVRGKISISKHGEILSGWNAGTFADQGPQGGFVYEDVPIGGAVFEIAAAEDIYTADHSTDEAGNRILETYGDTELKKDAVLAQLTTDEAGRAELTDLPLGRYLIREVSAPEGFALMKEPREVVLAYGDQDTAEVSCNADVENRRIRTSVTLKKTDAVTGQIVAGAVYGLYAAEDITDRGGNVLAAKDTLLEQETTDSEGKLSFGSDLPLGLYYVKELSAPAGYLLSEEAVPVDLRSPGQDAELAEQDLEVTDQPVLVEKPEEEKKNLPLQPAPQKEAEQPAEEEQKEKVMSPRTGDADPGAAILLLGIGALGVSAAVARGRRLHR